MTEPQNQTSLTALNASYLEDGQARKLAHIAFMGAFCGYLTEAETIFQSLRRLRPQNGYVEIGLAIVWITTHQFMDALVLLERLKPSDAEQAALIQVCRAWAMQGRGYQSVACKILEEVVTLNSNTVLTQFAQALLSENESM